MHHRLRRKVSRIAELVIGCYLTWSDTGFNDSDLQIRPRRREVVCTRETRAPRANNDDVRDSALVHLGEVSITTMSARPNSDCVVIRTA